MSFYKVAYIEKESIQYPNAIEDFSPSLLYPEYRYRSVSEKKNDVYDSIRQSFIQLGLDKQNIDSPNWNPLKEYINKGDVVLIKPNWVMHYNPEPINHSMECLVTNPSAIRAVIDYVLIALDGTGEIVLGDAPMYQCDIDELFNTMSYNKLISFYQKNGVDNIKCVDFRNVILPHNSSLKNGKNEMISSDKVIVSEKGIEVNLGDKSKLDEFSEDDINRFRIFGYSSELMKNNHTKGCHKYLIHNEVLRADCIINMPKCKTHRKAGMTACAKNFIGINCRKEYLPHHRTGSVERGGDEYSSHSFFKCLHTKVNEIYNESRHPSIILKIAKKTTRGAELLFSKDKKYDGCWYGNDTLWRTITDLNYLVLHADKNGVLRDEEQRKILNVCDMIVSGEGEGPLKPSPKYINTIIVGERVSCVDAVVCSVMGFDYHKVKYIPTLLAMDAIETQDIIIVGSGKEKSIDELASSIIKHNNNFIPASGWVGHIEKDQSE